MKHYLLLLNNGKHAISDEKELRKAEISAEKYDGFECWETLGEIDPQKVADNRWTTIRPDFPCLFVARWKEIGKDKLLTLDSSGDVTFQGTYSKIIQENLQADEYFIIERY